MIFLFVQHLLLRKVRETVIVSFFEPFYPVLNAILPISFFPGSNDLIHGNVGMNSSIPILHPSIGREISLQSARNNCALVQAQPKIQQDGKEHREGKEDNVIRRAHAGFIVHCAF